jgi:signal transduction histidine kinase
VPLLSNPPANMRGPRPSRSRPSRPPDLDAEAAGAAERDRLARDLHDTATQSLFSAHLMADVLPRLWERDPAEGRRCLDDLCRLTRGALADMRTLLFELHLPRSRKPG